MLTRDRRLGFRIPLGIFLNQYVNEKLVRGLTTNLSESGVFLNRVAEAASGLGHVRDVGLEFELPGTGEVIWARGEVCYQSADDYVQGAGIRFTALPVAHARLIRDYCIEARQAHLDELLAKIRTPC